MKTKTGKSSTKENNNQLDFVKKIKLNKNKIKPEQSLIPQSNHFIGDEYRTFRTKDFSHKSVSTSFGLFAQFLEVISHNNYKWETSI